MEQGDFPHRPAPFATATDATLATVSVLMTDLDDTVTSEGRLPARSYSAIEALQTAGVGVVIVTGRPAGWCDFIARMWPVSGVIGENGALFYAYDHAARRMTRLYQKTAAERHADMAFLDTLLGKTLDAFPQAAIASDQPFRVSDVAVDFREDVAPLSLEQANRIAAFMRAEGATAKVSSIHVNAWVGDFSKVTMARRVLTEIFEFGERDMLDKVMYCGDSGNDEPMFEAFDKTLGVANIEPFLAQMRAQPRWISAVPAADGFTEVAERLVAVRTKGT